MKQRNSQNKEKKQFLGIHFKCCNIYGRIYKNKDGTVYEGMCPGCKRVIFVPIGKEGSTSRFFIAE